MSLADTMFQFPTPMPEYTEMMTSELRERQLGLDYNEWVEVQHARYDLDQQLRRRPNP